MLAQGYRNEVVGPWPPLLFPRLLCALLAPTGRLLGYRRAEPISSNPQRFEKYRSSSMLNRFAAKAQPTQWSSSASLSTGGVAVADRRDLRSFSTVSGSPS